MAAKRGRDVGNVCVSTRERKYKYPSRGLFRATFSAGIPDLAATSSLPRGESAGSALSIRIISLLTFH